MKKTFAIFALFFPVLSMQGQDQLRPTDDMALVHIFVADFDLVPEEGAVIHLVSQDGSIKEKGIADVDGEFKILLPEGQVFQVNVEKFGENFDFGTFEIPVAKGAIQFKHTFKIRVVENYVRNYTLENVHFDSGSYEIRKESENALKELLGALKGNPNMKVEIAGHTDDVGDDKSNMKLSQQRADAIVKWLIAKGISADRLIAKGYGEVKPVADNSAPEGRQKNRRTEVRVIKE